MVTALFAHLPFRLFREAKMPILSNAPCCLHDLPSTKPWHSLFVFPRMTMKSSTSSTWDRTDLPTAKDLSSGQNMIFSTFLLRISLQSQISWPSTHLLVTTVALEVTPVVMLHDAVIAPKGFAVCKRDLIRKSLAIVT
jgi:hypothetical protein